MTTQSWSTRVRHDSSAVFREWGSEFSAKLAAAGLVQTADTGQINWVTVAIPGANTDGGYEIWSMNDTQQGTAPIYFRINYGTGNFVNCPRITIGVGIASNGSGSVTTIGGGAATQRIIMGGNTNQTTDTLRNSYMCVTVGFFGVSWKQGTSSNEAFFAACRTVDSAGVATATGAMIIWGGGTTGSVTATQAMRFAATAVLYTVQTAVVNTMLGFFPQALTSTLVGSDIQVALGWTATPAMAPLIGVCGVLDGEVVAGNTFSLALVGSTSHTYIGLTPTSGPFGPSAAGATGFPKYAMLWE